MNDKAKTATEVGEEQRAKMITQRKEFDAMAALAVQWDRVALTAVVDDDYPAIRHAYENALHSFLEACALNGRRLEYLPGELTFAALRTANLQRCTRWHPGGVDDWTPSEWAVAIAGELGEMCSLVKMANRDRDGLVGNKFKPTWTQVAKEAADVLIYLDLFCARLAINLGDATRAKFNEVSDRNGFPDRL